MDFVRVPARPWRRQILLRGKRGRLRKVLCTSHPMRRSPWPAPWQRRNRNRNPCSCGSNIVNPAARTSSVSSKCARSLRSCSHRRTWTRTQSTIPWNVGMVGGRRKPQRGSHRKSHLLRRSGSVRRRRLQMRLIWIREARLPQSGHGRMVLQRPKCVAILPLLTTAINRITPRPPAAKRTSTHRQLLAHTIAEISSRRPRR